MAGILLMVAMGLSVVKADIIEVETSCGLFDCYTILETSFNINPTFIGNVYDSEELPETYKHEHIGKIEGLKIEVLTKNSVKVTGTIQGATDNLWGLTVLGDNSFENSTWWNSTFNSCYNVTITEMCCEGELVSYPTLINITDTTDMNSDYSDIRYVNESCNNNGEELYYWIAETNPNFVETWVNVTLPNCTDRIISLYFNNSTSPVYNKSDPYHVFSLFTTDDVGWVEDGGLTSSTLENETSLVFFEDTSIKQYSSFNNFGAFWYPTGVLTENFYTDFNMYIQNEDISNNLGAFVIPNDGGTHDTSKQLGQIAYLDGGGDEDIVWYNGASVTLLETFSKASWYRVSACHEFNTHTSNITINDTVNNSLAWRNSISNVDYIELGINDDFYWLINSFRIRPCVCEYEPAVSIYGLQQQPTTTTSATTTTVGSDWYFHVELGDDLTVELMWSIAIIIFILAVLSIASKK